MTCPTCNALMSFVRDDVSYGEANKAYDRSLYRCFNDDAWVTVETPREE